MSPSESYRRLAAGATVGLVATVAYRWIQRLTLADAAVRNDCWAWHWVPFHAGWVWPYLSMFLLVGLPWFLLREMREVNRFAACLLGTALVGWITFAIYPTACSRPTATGQPFYYAVLQSLDRPNNCLPCLHAAFPVLAAYSLVHGGPNVFRRLSGRLLLALWVFVICVSIVALRQHTDVDVVAGLLLGGVAAATGVRPSRQAVRTA